METTPPTNPAEPVAELTPDLHLAPFWSPWATIGWGLVVTAVFVVVQTVVLIAWSALWSMDTLGVDGEALAAEATTNGDLLATGTLASAVVCGLLVVALSAIGSRKQLTTSLALTAPSVSSAGMWLAITGGLLVASDALTWALDKPIVPEVMTDFVRSATNLPLFWMAIIVAAPLFEELFVRGFLLEGLRRGNLGDAGAIVATSLFWASIHIQYGWYEIGTIFIFGLALGLARIASRSLWVPIAMHVAANLVATVEAWLIS